MPNVRQAMFPYGMSQNADGTWTFFNRHYKPLGVITDAWAAWDDPRHKMDLKKLSPSKRAKLDIHGLGGTDNRIYFYNDATNPESSAADLKVYLEKLKILIGLQEKIEY